MTTIPDIKELTNEDLTIADRLKVSEDGEYSVHGSGVFDDLMEASNKHIDAQFKLGRIQGSDFAKVYTASMQASMSSAVQYLLGKSNHLLVAAQIRKIEAEMLLVGKQGDKIDAEISLYKAKEKTEAKQLEVLAEQAKMIAAQAKGFQDSANQKYLKTIIDGQAVNANIEGVGSAATLFSDSNLTAVGKSTKPY